VLGLRKLHGRLKDGTSGNDFPAMRQPQASGPGHNGLQVERHVRGRRVDAGMSTHVPKMCKFIATTLFALAAARNKGLLYKRSDGHHDS